jgi:hypothetical protein
VAAFKIGKYGNVKIIITCLQGKYR